MQEVCSSLTVDQMGPQIKSESPLNPLQSTLIINGPQNQQNMHQSAPLLQTKLVGNCDKTRGADSYWMPTETGFINSQPSMAEFLTHLGPESPKLGSQQGYPLPSDNGIDSVPEYPWMKEKKTARKGGGNNQGRIFKFIYAKKCGKSLILCNKWSKIHEKLQI